MRQRHNPTPAVAPAHSAGVTASTMSHGKKQRSAAHSRCSKPVKRLKQDNSEGNRLQESENTHGPYTFAETNTLRRLTTVCAWCNRTPDSEGCWHNFEDVRASSQGVTHGICPECAEKSYQAYRTSETKNTLSPFLQCARAA